MKNRNRAPPNHSKNGRTNKLTKQKFLKLKIMKNAAADSKKVNTSSNGNGQVQGLTVSKTLGAVLDTDKSALQTRTIKRRRSNADDQTYPPF